ncbi:MAG: VanZ family protein [Bacillaceae bacterium]|nr:VanZ family protein [Bacillaceae bacterium]
MGSFDIDDVILNTVGALIGFFLYDVVRKRVSRRLRTKQR